MERRNADWTLVQLSGSLRKGARYGDEWQGWWVALNQEGAVYGSGTYGDVVADVKYWLERQPPRGAAHGEGGRGAPGPLPGTPAAPVAPVAPPTAPGAGRRAPSGAHMPGGASCKYE